MTIEVREMLIRTVVGPAPGAEGPHGGLPAALPAPQLRRELAQLRAQILAECRQLLADELRQQHER